MAFDFDLGNAISNLGKSLAGGDDSPLGSLVGNVIDVAGRDGWDGIVDQVTNSDSPIINAAVGVLKDNVGEQWHPLVNGVKGLADGDPNAVAGAAIGGLRDWAGPERFDEIATGIGSAIKGDVSGAANALLGEVAEAVDNETFTAIVAGANALGVTQLGDAAVGEAMGEFRELVGESAWSKMELAAEVHEDIVEAEQAEDGAKPTENPADELIDPFDEQAADGQAATDGAQAPSAERPLSEDPVDGLIDPFDEQADGEIGGSPGKPFGDTPLEDILEPSPINPNGPATPGKPFGDTPLEDILEPSAPIVMAPNTGIAPDHLVAPAPAAAASVADGGIDGGTDDAVGDFTMGTGFPGGAPLPQSDQFIALETAPAPAAPAPAAASFEAATTDAVATVATEPMTALGAEVASIDTYAVEVDRFFDEVQPAPADTGADPAELA